MRSAAFVRGTAFLRLSAVLILLVLLVLLILLVLLVLLLILVLVLLVLVTIFHDRILHTSICGKNRNGSMPARGLFILRHENNTRETAEYY